MEKPLFTNENVIDLTHLDEIDMEVPIAVYDDAAGNQTVADGNHRAYKAFHQNLPLKREVIGQLKDDVSKDPYFRPISELKPRRK